MASSTVNLKVDAKDLAEKIEAKIVVKTFRLHQFKLRLWLAAKLVYLAQVISWINFDIVEQHPLERVIEEFGERGVSLSIGYSSAVERWQFHCTNRAGDGFGWEHRPNSLAHCIEIAHKEAEKRGWLDES